MNRNETTPLRVAQIIGKMNGGGAEQVVMNYYEHIDKSRVQFDFFTFAGSKHIPAERIKELGGGLYLLCGIKRPFRYVKTLTKLLRENRYDIVHCHMSTLSFLPLLAAKRAGVRVRIVHNHSTAGGAAEFVRNIAKAVFKPFAKLFATDRFACSSFAAKWFFGAAPVCDVDDFVAPKNAVRILRNAIDTEKFAFSQQKRTAIRGEFKVPKNTLLFLHVGRFCPQKNQQFLIDIFREIEKQHKNSRLIMVGEGGDMEIIQARIINAGLLAKALFAGQRSDIDAFYSAADCFLLPSNYEGLGMAAIEAQYAGTPCVLSDKVPIEAKIIDKVQFLSLKTPARDWAFAAINSARRRNGNALEQFREAGYDITQEAEKLCAYYLRMSGKTDE